MVAHVAVPVKVLFLVSLVFLVLLLDTCSYSADVTCGGCCFMAVVSNFADTWLIFTASFFGEKYDREGSSHQNKIRMFLATVCTFSFFNSE